MSPAAVSGAFLTIIALAAGLVVGGWMVVIMLGMVFNREINFFELLIWLLAFVGLLATTLATVGTVAFPVLLLMTLSLGLAVPIMSWAADRIGLRHMRSQDLEAYLRAMQERPDIPYYARKVGDLFYKSGDWQLAVQYYEQSLKIHKDPTAVYYLEKARERMELGEGEPVTCVACGKLNPRGSHQCLHCGEGLPGAHELLHALGEGRGRKLLLVSAAVLLGGGMLLSVLRTGAAFLNGFILFCGLGLALLYFYVVKARR